MKKLIIAFLLFCLPTPAYCVDGLQLGLGITLTSIGGLTALYALADSDRNSTSCDGAEGDGESESDCEDRHRRGLTTDLFLGAAGGILLVVGITTIVKGARAKKEKTEDAASTRLDLNLGVTKDRTPMVLCGLRF